MLILAFLIHCQVCHNNNTTDRAKNSPLFFLLLVNRSIIHSCFDHAIQSPADYYNELNKFIDFSLSLNHFFTQSLPCKTTAQTDFFHAQSKSRKFERKEKGREAIRPAEKILSKSAQAMKKNVHGATVRASRTHNKYCWICNNYAILFFFIDCLFAADLNRSIFKYDYHKCFSLSRSHRASRPSFADFDFIPFMQRMFIHRMQQMVNFLFHFSLFFVPQFSLAYSVVPQ